MAGSVNKVVLIGNLGADPEVRNFPSGGQVCNLRVATSERWKHRETGEMQERTEWHQVAIFNEGLARIAQQYLRKGSKVYLEGQLQTRKWQDQEGRDRYSTEVVLRGYNCAMQLLDRRDGASEGSSDGSSYGAGYSGGYDNRGPAPYDDRDQGGNRGGPLPGNAGFVDDEIPF